MLGRAAFDAGLAATAAGDRDAAIAWLDRACRLSPGDRTYTLALATQCLTDDPARAARLFALVTGTDDVREAWLGLASARLRLGEPQAAAAALSAALSRHTLLPGIGALAAAVAAASGAPGWCGLTTGGRLQLGGAAGPPALFLDGRAWAARDGMTPPDTARELAVRIDGRDALGSPIAVAAIRRTEGLVGLDGGGLEGWAWHPGDPAREPVLHLVAASGARRTIRVAPEAHAVPGARAMARARRFAVSAKVLARLRGPFAVTGPDGTPLLGSPLDPAVLPAPVEAGLVGPRPPAGLVRRRRPVDVVIPVHAGGAATLACLDSVFANTGLAQAGLAQADCVQADCAQAGSRVRIVVVDDATPDPALAAALDRLAARRRIVLIRHAVNRGFPASANAGLAACARRDVVLLNSDVLVPAGWLDRLREAAYSAPDIGSVTPLSNDASLVSYPGPAGTNPVPDAAEAARLDRLAWRANGAGTADIPVGVGFCLYLRRDCLDATGTLRADIFAQGYGEEVDFCLRARHLGWRHVAATGVFVAHVGGQSFGASRRFLMDRNQALLDRLYPGLDALLAAWAAAGGLAAPRRRLEEARWRAARPRGRQPGGDAVLLITHADGGGVERRIAASCAAIARAGDRPVVLRPARAPDGGPAARLDDGAGAPNAWPNLIYALPSELRTLRARLRADRPRRIELHHLLGHDPAVLDLLAGLGLPYDVHVHDYAWFCARIALVGPQRRYCGEPAPDGCEACLAQAGRVIAEALSVSALIDRSARLLAGADRVLAPSRDAAARMRRHFPGIRPRIAPHENDRAILGAPAPVADGACRVVTVGAIGIEKGFDILLDCARDAAARRLPLDFVVVGHTIDDATLIDTGRVFVTGEFAPADLPALIRAQRPSLGLLPSVWPETWCFALSDLWRAGLHVAAFDIGAQAARIRARSGRGLLLPLGLPAASINNTLLAAAHAQAHQ